MSLEAFHFSFSVKSLCNVVSTYQGMLVVVKLGCWSLSYLRQALCVLLHMARVAGPPASGRFSCLCSHLPTGFADYVLLCLGVCDSGDSNSGPHAIQ